MSLHITLQYVLDPGRPVEHLFSIPISFFSQQIF